MTPLQKLLVLLSVCQANRVETDVETETETEPAPSAPLHGGSYDGSLQRVFQAASLRMPEQVDQALFVTKKMLRQMATVGKDWYTEKAVLFQKDGDAIADMLKGPPEDVLRQPISYDHGQIPQFQEQMSPFYSADESKQLTVMVLVSAFDDNFAWGQPSFLAWAQSLQAKCKHVIWRYVYDRTQIADISAQVQDESLVERSVDLLVLVGHGHSAQMQMGFVGKHQQLQFNKLFNAWSLSSGTKTFLAALAPFLKAKASVFIMSCGTADAAGLLTKTTGGIFDRMLSRGIFSYLDKLSPDKEFTVYGISGSFTPGMLTSESGGVLPRSYKKKGLFSSSKEGLVKYDKDHQFGKLADAEGEDAGLLKEVDLVGS